MIRAVVRNNSIIYTVSVLIPPMAASITFLSAGTGRVLPAEILLSRYVAPVWVHVMNRRVFSRSNKYTF